MQQIFIDSVVETCVVGGQDRSYLHEDYFPTTKCYTDSYKKHCNSDEC